MQINDETVNKAFSKVKDLIRTKKGLRKGLADVRKLITQTVQSCSDNVVVKIYMDEVLDDPIVISNGRGDNKLVLTIDSEDGVDFTWTETTMAKAFWDGWGVGTKITKAILQTLAGLSSAVLQTTAAPLAIPLTK